MSTTTPQVNPIGSISGVVWAWEAPVETPIERLVLVRLADITGGGQHTYDRSLLLRLSEEFKTGPQQVEDAIESLADGGLLVIFADDEFVAIAPAVVQ